MEPVKLFGVRVNSDLTEGKGETYFKFFSTDEGTAKRMAKGQDIQGADGTVLEVDCWKEGNIYFCPTRLYYPTREDILMSEELRKKRELLRTIKSVLSAEDFDYIKGLVR